MKKMLTAVIILIVVAIVAVACSFRSHEDADSLKMTVFKIGKADAILVRQGEHCVLIDSGEDDDASEILSYLEQNGVDKLDALVITHYDKDHVGGAAQIIKGIAIDKAYDRGDIQANKLYKEYKKALDGAGVTNLTVTEDVSLTLGNIQMDILSPMQKNYENENDFSLITKISAYGRTILLCGDAMEQRLREFMQQRSQDVPCDILKVPYHGNYNDACAEFIKQCGADYAVITDSAKNPADAKLIDALESADARVFETLNGDIEVIIDTKGDIHASQN